jgi:hypothetical protein
MTAQHLSMRAGPNEPTSVEKAEQTQDLQKSWRIHDDGTDKPGAGGPGDDRSPPRRHPHEHAS